MITVQYERHGGHLRDRSHAWCAVDDDTCEALDYGSLEYLERSLREDGTAYRVRTRHRGKPDSFRHWTPTPQDRRT